MLPVREGERPASPNISENLRKSGLAGTLALPVRIVKPARPLDGIEFSVQCCCSRLADGTSNRKPLTGVCVAKVGLDLPGRNIIIDIMKITKKPSSRGNISTHEMRFQFGRVLQAVKAGRSLTLTYRSKPLATIVPLKPHAEISPDDPVFRLHELAEPLGPLSNAEMDAAIYGR